MSKPAASIDICLITGGSGFLGSNIAKTLLDRGCQVRIFDLNTPDLEHGNLTFIQGNLSDTERLNEACRGVDTVFHTASIICLMGGSAVSSEYRQKGFDVNVKGTENVIRACHQQQVKRLVYTSSNNVVFNGTPCPDMDQRTQYATCINDVYTETKIIAEKMALAANGQNGLLTCAIRPSGIYGPGSNYMLDGLVRELANGRLIATIGNANSIQDNSFIDNVVHGHILAAEALVEGNAACGKAYFITDDEPRNNFEFFRPVIEGLGYPFPTWVASPRLLHLLATVWQWLHFRLGFPVPFITPKEVEKASISHFSNIKDAERDLDYSPVKTLDEAMQLTIPYYRQFIEDLKKGIRR